MSAGNATCASSGGKCKPCDERAQDLCPNSSLPFLQAFALLTFFVALATSYTTFSAWSGRSAANPGITALLGLTMFVFSSISFGTVTCSSVSQYQAVWEADSSSDVASCVFYYGTSDVGVGQGTGAGAGPRKLKAGVGFIFEIFTFLASISLTASIRA